MSDRMSKTQKVLLILTGCLVLVCYLLSLQTKNELRVKSARPVAVEHNDPRSTVRGSLATTPHKWNAQVTTQSNSSLSSSRLQRLRLLRSQHLKAIANHSKSAPPSISTPQGSHVGEEGCIKIGNFSSIVRTDVWKTFRTLLENYTQFHKDGIERLKRGNKSVRTLTWSCYEPKSCSGTGDQFSRIKQVFLLALMSRRVFTIYWDSESLKTMHYLQPNKIDWSYFDEDSGMHIVHDEEVKNLDKGYYNQMYELLMSQNRSHVTMNHELMVPIGRSFSRVLSCKNISSEMARIGMSALWYKDIPKVFIYGEIIRYLFKFLPEVVNAVDVVQKFLGIHDQPYLGVHIRTGFLGTDFEEEGRFSKKKIYRDTADWESTIKCSIDKATKSLGPNATVFLATDSYLVKQLAAEKYSTRVRQINMTLQHVAYIKQGGEKEQKQEMEFSLRNIDGYTATWIDFLLLARSSVLVHSISMFSGLAQQYCSIPRHYYTPRCTKTPK